MCLSVVNKEKPPETGYGWKVFSELDGRLVGDTIKPYMVRPMRRWLKAKDFSETKRIPDGKKRYKAGWHIFVDKESAEKWASPYQEIHRVKHRKAHTAGMQEDFLSRSSAIIVADEIFIFENSI